MSSVYHVLDYSNLFIQEEALFFENVMFGEFVNMRSFAFQSGGHTLRAIPNEMARIAAVVTSLGSLNETRTCALSSQLQTI